MRRKRKGVEEASRRSRLGAINPLRVLNRKHDIIIEDVRVCT